MSFERFIANRYFASGRMFVAVSTWITIIGVTLGVGTVCFVMSMHNGFEHEIRSRLLGTTSHISVFPLQQTYITEYQELVDTLATFDGVRAASPFIYFKAGISSINAGDGIVIRGIDPELESRTAEIDDKMIAGSYSFDPQIDARGDTLPGILVGTGLADRMSVFVGDAVVLYAFLSAEELRSNRRPRIAKFAVTGIFETGMHEWDGQLAYIDLPAAMDLFKTGGGVTAAHLKLDNIYEADDIARVIDSNLGYRYDVVPWNVLHRNLFAWIEMEKLVLFLGFTLIVIVAAFSIISTLVMLTMDKRSEIGILKTIGSTPGAILRIFLLKGLFIGVSGVLLGWGLAGLAAWLQNEFELIRLPGDIYFVSYLPIDIHLTDFLIAGGLTLVICLIAAWFPARQAARVSVIEVLRR